MANSTAVSADPAARTVVAATAENVSVAATHNIVGNYAVPNTTVLIVMARPESRPDLWTQYLDGLERTYLSFGAEAALDLRAIFTGRELPLFAVAVDAAGDVVGGLRAHGPFVDPSEAHAVAEFASDPIGQRTVWDLVEARLDRGVAEIKGVWTAPDVPKRRVVSNALARGYIHMMETLDVDFVFCTAADHAARRWATAGGRPVDGLAPVAYPDARYRTSMLWWNRASYAEHCDPEQLRLVRTESALLSQSRAAMSGALTVA